MSKLAISAIALLAVFDTVLEAGPPSGWGMGGSDPAAYECNIDPSAAYYGQPSVLIKAKRPTVEGFGTMMQCFRSERYLGKRVRFSAFVRSEGISAPEDWAGLWMRVDRLSVSRFAAFDNMQNRPVKGTTPWRNYEVVLAGC